MVNAGALATILNQDGGAKHHFDMALHLFQHRFGCCLKYYFVFVPVCTHTQLVKPSMHCDLFHWLLWNPYFKFNFSQKALRKVSVCIGATLAIPGVDNICLAW